MENPVTSCVIIDEYVPVWIRGAIQYADPELNNTKSYDDLEYFEIEDLMAIDFSDEANLFLDKIM